MRLFRLRSTRALGRRPKASITLSDDKRPEEIILGDPVKGDKKGRIYAKTMSRSQILTVGKRIFQDFPQTKD